MSWHCSYQSHCRLVIGLYLGPACTPTVQDERNDGLLEFQETLLRWHWWSLSRNRSLSFEEHNEVVDIVLQHPLQLWELSCTGPVPYWTEHVHKRKRCISSLSSRVLFRRPIVVKSSENIVRLTLNVPLRNQVLLLHSNSIFFWISKISTRPSTSVCRLSNIKNRSPRSVLWYWYGISSSSSSVLGLANILQQRVWLMDCDIPSHSRRWLKTSAVGMLKIDNFCNRL